MSVSERRDSELKKKHLEKTLTDNLADQPQN